MAPAPRGGRGGRQKDTTRINEDINVPKVRLVDEEGEQVGVVATEQALDRAYDAGLDLVEVSPNADPPVCKILDYGKYKFQMQKRAAEARKNQVTITVKEITLRPRTEDHDYQVKLRKMTEFLNKGDKVKVTVRFRGREMAHQDLGADMLKRIKEDLSEYSKVDSHPRMEGRQMVMMLSSTVNQKPGS